MKHAECERLVDRYMCGAMSVSEEQDFFIQVAVNDELRQTLKAYRVVDTALRKDRSATPSPGTDRSRTHVMAMLAATAPLAGGAAAGSGAAAADVVAKGAAATSASTAAGGITAGSVLLGAGATKLTVAIIAAVALSVGTFIVGPIVNGHSDGNGRAVRPPDTASALVLLPASVPTNLLPANLPSVATDTLVKLRSAEPESVSEQHIPLHQTVPVLSTTRANRPGATAIRKRVNAVATHIAHQAVPTPTQATEDQAPRPVPSTVDSISFKVDMQVPDNR